jgi:starch-binding outer membrane protein, SusD/RagB family
MKNIYKVSLMALFMGFFSCDDATDIVQESELSEDLAYQTVDDLRSGLYGVYAAYGPDAGGNGDGDILVFNDLFTDNMRKGDSNTGQGVTEYNFTLQPLTPFVGTIWGNRYGTINYANRVLRAWDRIFPTLTSQDDIEAANEIKAQLLALRALCHFDLMCYFVEDYNALESPGVILMDFVPADVLDVFPRATVGESWDFINNDIEQATVLMGDTFDSVLEHGSGAAIYYLGPEAINAIHARIAIFQGDNEQALTLSTDLVSARPIATLTATVKYADIFNNDATSTEDIFRLPRRLSTDSSILNLYFFNAADDGGDPYYEVSKELYELYSDADVRKDVVVNPDFAPALLLEGKYKGNVDGKSPRMNDFKMIKSSEMQLIKAEAQARLGNLTGAAASVRLLRQRRITGSQLLPVYDDLQEALADVLLERRKELAFEGHRFLDLKRIGQEIGLGIDRNEEDCASFQATNCFLPAGDYRFTMPIPRSETSANPTIQQNTGYTNQ